jgi:GR25 family glycosyltransferase involved in LPS biosynthesis
VEGKKNKKTKRIQENTNFYQLLVVRHTTKFLYNIMIHSFFYINLSSRRDKLENMNKQIQKIKTIIPIERFEAINGTSYNNLSDLVLAHQNIKFQPNIFCKEEVKNTPRYKAKIACWLSHFTIINKFKNCSEKKWIVIFEDDIQINYDFESLQHHMSKTINSHQNPDVIILGDRIGTAGINILDNMKKYPKKKNTFGCESYAIYIPSIPKFIKYLYLDTIQNKCSLDDKFFDLNKGIIKIVPLQYQPFTTCLDPLQQSSDIEI